MQRSVRENIALPFSARLAPLGPDRPPPRGARAVGGAIERLQIDTRAQREVQRLSGGNQQKVTIARWIAADARTILCFDPTRGIDVAHQAGDLPPAARARRAGQVGALLHLRARGGAARLRPRRGDLRRPRRRRLARRDRRRGDADPRRLRPAARSPTAVRAMTRWLRREGWVVGLFVLFAALLVVDPADPARLRRRRLRLARPRRPALRLRRRRADRRRHRRRHRPLGRLDDGADQRHRRPR